MFFSRIRNRKVQISFFTVFLSKKVFKTFIMKILTEKLVADSNSKPKLIRTFVMWFRISICFFKFSSLQILLDSSRQSPRKSGSFSYATETTYFQLIFRNAFRKWSKLVRKYFGNAAHFSSVKKYKSNSVQSAQI